MIGCNMGEWYGAKLVLKESAAPIEPFAEELEAFFKAYAKVLKEVYISQKEETTDEKLERP